MGAFKAFARASDADESFAVSVEERIEREYFLENIANEWLCRSRARLRPHRSISKQNRKQRDEDKMAQASKQRVCFAVIQTN